MQPNYSFVPVSLVADRNSLHKLFDIAMGKFSKDGWRIEVELVGGTMFLTRFEERNTGWSNPGSGYGHEFEKRFLKYDTDLRNSLTHHRFVEYELGGMRCVVRFETDGYVELPSVQKDTAIATQNAPKASNPRPESQTDLEASMQAISLKNANAPLAKDSIAVIQRGHLTSEDSILEVKCLKHNPEKGINKLADYKVQCWISQTQHLFMGKHVDGVVSKVNRTDMREIFGSWEDEHQAQLQKMMTLIRGIKKVASSTEDGKCCITADRKERPAKVRVFQSNAKPLKLSDEMKRRFWGGVDLTG